jgi:MoxR-like ATPase
MSKKSQNPTKKVLHVSDSPTRPSSGNIAPSSRKFDINEIFEGSAPTTPEELKESVIPEKTTPDEKARKAYFWIVNNAIISPYYDVEFNIPGSVPKKIKFKGAGSELTLPTDQSYSSFVLLPILNFLVRKRALFIGGPGRGKTASSILMGLLAGYSKKEIKQAIQHGQPQMTITDLLGNPLPKDLLQAKAMEEVKISWRKWIDMRVKIVDEYNRIPTRTQSALLTLLADGYAEILDQVVECGESAWFLTANDDLGGGTYQVIDALKDRIDIIVKAMNFNSRFLSELLDRIENNFKPDEVIPDEIIFTQQELDKAYQEILKIKIPHPILRRLEFFTSQFDFCDLAASIMEYKSKDSIRLGGKTVSQVCKTDCGRDKIKAICSQTENGVSVRAYLTILNFTKALAYFRGNTIVELQDLRQILPWILHEKLIQNKRSAFFDVPGHDIYRVDKISWIKKIFDLTMDDYNRLDLDSNDPVLDVEREFNKGLDGLTIKVVQSRIWDIEAKIKEFSKNSKLFNYIYDDILKLKSFWMRYRNYLEWLESN